MKRCRGRHTRIGVVPLVVLVVVAPTLFLRRRKDATPGTLNDDPPVSNERSDDLDGPSHSSSWRSMGSLGSARSIGSFGSFCSIGSIGSSFSIGSIGSSFSIGSIGSFCSIASIFSAASIGSFGSTGARFSWRAVGYANLKD